MYRRSWQVAYGGARENMQQGSQSPEQAAQQGRVYDSADFLANNLEQVPVHVIPCILGTLPEGTPAWMAASFLGSIIPAIWSFQLALRSRGLGSCYTTLHLAHHEEAAKLLGIPETVDAGRADPRRLHEGDGLQAGRRGVPVEITYWDEWKATR